MEGRGPYPPVSNAYFSSSSIPSAQRWPFGAATVAIDAQRAREH